MVDQAFVDHDSKLGGIHKKRAIRYSLEKLEAQKLIERCPAPAEFKGKVGLRLSGRRLVQTFQVGSPLAHVKRPLVVVDLFRLLLLERI